MLTLSPQSVCDVCAEEYGPRHLPHSIPCGHVLCAECCKNIIEKCAPRATPACPFCREHFGTEGVRKIRIDFNVVTSGRSTPWSPVIEANEPVLDTSFNKEEEIILVERTSTRSPRLDARQLEEKVAKVAQKRTTVEEVAALQKEISLWLKSNAKEATNSLSLSAALLHAIIVNYQSHEHAAKSSKASENHLRERIDQLERDLRNQNERHAQECQTLMAEINRHRIKAAAPSLGVPSTSGYNSPPAQYFPGQYDPAHRQVKSASTSPLHSPPMMSPGRLPTLSPLHSPPMQTLSPAKMPSAAPLPNHYSPPQTPAPPTNMSRSKSSAPTTSPHTRSASASIGNSLLFRTDTPVARPSHMPSIRSHTPGLRPAGPSIAAGKFARAPSPPPPVPTPAPAPAARKTRTLSMSSQAAPAIVRSTSDDERHYSSYHGDNQRSEPSRAKSPTSGSLFSRWVPSGRPGSTAPKRTSLTPAPRTAFGSTIPTPSPTPGPAMVRRSSVSQQPGRPGSAVPQRMGTPARALG